MAAWGDLSDDDDEDGGVFDQSIVSFSEFMEPSSPTRSRSTSHSVATPQSRSRTGTLTASDIRGSESSSSSSNKKKITEEERLDNIEAIVQYETVLAINLRASMSEGLSRTMLARQQDDINKAFSEVNFLRAELVELYNNKSMSFLQKRLLYKYIIANQKELSSRTHYAKLAMASAKSDAQLKDPKLLDEWKLRIESDFGVVTETRALRNDKEINKNPVIKKKHEYEYNRAKAVLKADYAAVEAAWPNTIDTGTMMFSGERSSSGRQSLGEIETSEGRESKGRKSRSRAGSASATFSASDIYG